MPEIACWMMCFVVLCESSLVFAEEPCRSFPSAEVGTTVLGIKGPHFTLNGTPEFLRGISYYGGLGASEETVCSDLDALRSSGFRWIRVWAVWESGDENVSMVDGLGNLRHPYCERLVRLVSECDRRGMVVDVTLARGTPDGRAVERVCLPDFSAHKQAVRSVIQQLRPFRNWYLDLANERDVMDARHVSIAELAELRSIAGSEFPELLVTASFGGHDLSEADIQQTIQNIGCDFLSVHRPRHPGTAKETEQKTLEILERLRGLRLNVPVHHQEPFRRGYDEWEPTADDFLMDLKGAVKGGAAGWCLHNGSRKNATDQQPRRCFDLRSQGLMEQLDSEERLAIQRMEAGQ